MSISIRDVILIAAIAFGIWVTFDAEDKPKWVLEVEAVEAAKSDQPMPEPDAFVAPIAE